MFSLFSTFSMITVVLVSSDLQELSVGRKYINASLSALIDYTHTPV